MSITKYFIGIKNIKDENKIFFFEKKLIPNNIFQLYHDKNLIPNYVKENIKKLNNNYNYYFYDFEESKSIINSNFSKDFSDKIILTIDKLPRYCHKSDIIRYCLLYIFGGIYIDCDLKPLYGFNKFLENINDVTLYSSFGKGAETFLCKTKIGEKKIHKMMANGIFASTKNNPILLELINYCIENPIDSNPDNRGINVIQLYNCIESKCKKINITAEPYKKLLLENEIIYLINQDESDIYGTNCFVNEDGIVLINPNDEEYNFKRQTSSFI